MSSDAPKRDALEKIRREIELMKIILKRLEREVKDLKDRRDKRETGLMESHAY